MIIYTEAFKVYKNTIKSQKVSDIEALNFSTDFTFNALNRIITICTDDQELHIKEIHYINQAAKALSLNDYMRNRFIIMAIDKLSLELLMSIKDELDQAEKHWLTSIIFNITQADGVIKNREETTIDNI
jgi:hypothetical protein